MPTISTPNSSNRSDVVDIEEPHSPVVAVGFFLVVLHFSLPKSRYWITAVGLGVTAS